ncbi:hypothetical protein G2W53_004466 [Senna tora]|uniref:Uncharacterized protein n=1 Tax=Senna tora TaxID=362788 RepID=A0A834XAY5_9FABA|nr:hypothetical protein G2W53_004466 [Senna tora]
MDLWGERINNLKVMDKSLVTLAFFVLLLVSSSGLKFGSEDAKAEAKARIDLEIPCSDDYQCPGCYCFNAQCQCGGGPPEENSESINAFPPN